MAGRGPKYYVVWRGAKPGVYDTWEECQKNVVGVAGSRFKSFPSFVEARTAFARAPPAIPPRGRGAARGKGNKRKGIATVLRPLPTEAGPLSLAVDAACSGVPGRGEYRGVLLPSRRQVFAAGPWDDCTNNVVEFLAVVRGLRWLDTRGLRAPLFSDSRTAISWAKNGGLCKTTHAPRTGTALSAEIAEAERWLASCPRRGDLLACLSKWNTKADGEIPADFGRK